MNLRRHLFTRPRRRGDVLVVSGPGGDAIRYRGLHLVEQLRLAGFAADARHRANTALARLAERYRCVILYRVPWDEEVARLLDRDVSRETAVVCDFDDLVFDPARANLIRGLGALSEADGRLYLEGIERQRTTLAACGTTITATDPLARAARQIVPQVGVVHNVASSVMVDQANSARRLAARQDKQIRIGYLSGTPTHDRDFLEAADGVLWALEADARVRFVAAGFLELDVRFAAHADRIERVPYQPWQHLPALLATLDVSLAPLEHGNEFVECKSCIKYLEAGLVGVPTIASPTPDFERVIDPGRNGLLAGSSPEWRDAFERLLRGPRLFRTLGDAAREDILTNHVTSRTACEAAESLTRVVPSLR